MINLMLWSGSETCEPNALKAPSAFSTRPPLARDAPGDAAGVKMAPAR